MLMRHARTDGLRWGRREVETAKKGDVSLWDALHQLYQYQQRQYPLPFGVLAPWPPISLMRTFLPSFRHARPSLISHFGIAEPRHRQSFHVCPT